MPLNTTNFYNKRIRFSRKKNLSFFINICKLLVQIMMEDKFFFL